MDFTISEKTVAKVRELSRHDRDNLAWRLRGLCCTTKLRTNEEWREVNAEIRKVCEEFCCEFPEDVLEAIDELKGR